MDGNDLGMIARVFMFLLKGLKYVLKLVWFTGLWWFCVPLPVISSYPIPTTKERAEEVKAAFLEAAKQIPADQRQEILDRMGQQKEIPTMGRLQYYQAEAEARRQLDTALKQEAQTRERNRTHDRDRGI